MKRVKYYQGSFTNIDNFKGKSGWQVIHHSTDMPHGMINGFERFQNANTTSPQFDVEDQEHKLVFQLQTDSNYVYYTYIKYGLLDGKGRPSMFASGYMFDVSAFIQNPSIIFNIKRENFAFTFEETKVNYESGELDVESYSLLDSLAVIGLAHHGNDKYTVLIRCVYFLFSD